MGFRIFFGYTDPAPPVAVTGTGAGAMAAFGGTGSGTMLFAVTGTGAGAMASFGGSGSGILEPAPTGTGTGAMKAFAGSGTGSLGFEATGSGAMKLFAGTGVGLLRIDPAIVPAGGPTAMNVYNPSGTLVIAGMPFVLVWETHRKLNSVGTWSASIPVAEPLISGEALSTLMERGWRVDLFQEGTHPLDRPDLEYLMYKGMVEDKQYDLDESGQTVCKLAGSFRGADLTSRNTPTSAQYVGSTIGAVATELVDGEAGGLTLPADSTRLITVSFNSDEGGHVMGRYHRLLRVGEYARWALRETWEEDALEFISIDAPPDSGYTMLNVDVAPISTPVRDIALIGGTPQFRREGRGIVNRVIPFGKDIRYEKDQTAETYLILASARYGLSITDEDDQGEAQTTVNVPLTLAHATLSSPYTVAHGTNSGIAQTSTLVIAARLTTGDTFTIDGTVYTVVASGASTPGQVNRGASASESRANVLAAINGTDGWNTAHATVTCGAFVNADATITADNVDDAITSGETFASPSNTLAAFDYPAGLHDYYYIEDTDSIARHGLVEMAMHRSDVSNPDPTDGAAKRVTAANVLYQLAALEIQKHRFPKLFVTVPVANGAAVWALPGDSIRVEYTGHVLV